jgi:hypothetical protein
MYSSRRNSFGRSTSNQSNSYNPYNSSSYNSKPNASDYAFALYADGGKRRKTKGKKSRKMKGGFWGSTPTGPDPYEVAAEERARLRNQQRNAYFPPQSGGSGSYTDGASYGMYVNGTGGSQWTRTMDQAGPYGGVPGNTIIGAQGQNVQPTSQMPTPSNLALVQKAGGKRRKGGFLGEVINQAIVPLSILGMQQTYRRKKGGKRGTRKNRKNRKH